MQRPKTLAILTCFHHEDWTREAVDTLAPQDCDIVVVDNRADTNVHGWNNVRDVFRFSTNLGPPCRFVPAWALMHEYKYILFADEDLKLKPCAVEYLEKAAAMTKGKFATLGIIGRRYNTTGEVPTMVRNNVSRDATGFTAVDLTCRLHFVKASDTEMASWMKVKMMRVGVPQELLWEDDMLLCHGIQDVDRWKSFLLPGDMAISDGNRGGRRKDGTAFCSRPNHNDNRNEFIKWAHKLGWRSLCNEA